MPMPTTGFLNFLMLPSGRDTIALGLRWPWRYAAACSPTGLILLVPCHGLNQTRPANPSPRELRA
eukprot:scaffold14722_cov65-Cyclotella_meneghiniana.AAC.2